MDKINEDFDIPYYIFEEIVDYIERGRPITRWDNVVALMGMAKVNNRLTEEQVKHLIETYK